MKSQKENEQIDFEKHGRDFLSYVAENEKKLKRNLAKNITYNPDIFEDVFNDTIVKVYTAITEKNTYIANFEQYFFMASKWVYVAEDDKTRRREKNAERNYFDDPTNDNVIADDYDTESREDDINNMLDAIGEVLTIRYTKKEIEIFFEYYRNKLISRSGYKQIAAKYNLKAKEATEIVKGCAALLKELQIDRKATAILAGYEYEKF